MMLRITLLSGLALAALAACGDDTGESGSGGGGTTTGASTTGATTATTGASGTTTGGSTTAATSTGSGEGGSGDGGSGDGGSGDGGSGDGGGSTAFDCDSYCTTITAACTGANAQYSIGDSCANACAGFDTGEFNDAGNTLGCRAYHASVAQDSPELHCPHAGPLGTGACSDAETSPCEAFCQIAEEVCPDAYAGDCTKVCADYVEGDYSVNPPAEGNSLACRMYHLSVAAQGGDNITLHCPHVGFENDDGVCED
jgi:hypothetical protein